MAKPYRLLRAQMSPAAEQQALAKAEAHLTAEEWQALTARVWARQAPSSRWLEVSTAPAAMPKPRGKAVGFMLQYHLDQTSPGSAGNTAQGSDHIAVQMRYSAMTTDNSTTDIATLFWNQVALCSHPAPCQTCCWEWQGRHTNNKWNYGRMTIQGKTYPTHRLAWVLTHGAIEDGLWVLHRCDNPPCVNPAHLFLGTAGDNARDAAYKGRLRILKGGAHPNARLTWEEVERIRTLYAQGTTQATLARMFHACAATVHRIVREKRWIKH